VDALLEELSSRAREAPVALAAVGAPPSSYLLNLAAAVDTTDLTLEDARSVLVAVAPIIGTPKAVQAAATIAEALGIALALEDALADQVPTCVETTARRLSNRLESACET